MKTTSKEKLKKYLNALKIAIFKNNSIFSRMSGHSVESTNWYFKTTANFTDMAPSS